MDELDNNKVSLDQDTIDYAVNIGQPSCLGDINFGAMTFWRNKNPNGLAPTLHSDDEEGPWLRLAVAKDAYPKATAGTPERCDRCELRDKKVHLGTPVSYTFDIRAEQGFPIVDAPLLALRIDRGRYIATVEHADIFAWSQFTVRVAPTRIKDEDGILELLVSHPPGVEERLVAWARGEFGHAGYPDPNINTGPVPGQGLQYFKIGPYRDKLKTWGDETAAIHMRNIKRAYWEHGAELREVG